MNRPISISVERLLAELREAIMLATEVYIVQASYDTLYPWLQIAMSLRRMFSSFTLVFFLPPVFRFQDSFGIYKNSLTTASHGNTCGQ